VAIQILASSTSFTYYGEEVGMSNSGRHDDIGLRSPMSFDDNPVNAGFSTNKPYRVLAINAAQFNLKIQKADPMGLWGHYQQLFWLKKNHPALGVGRFILLSKPDDELLIFERIYGNERVLVGINLSSNQHIMRIPVLNKGQKWLNLIEPKSLNHIDKSVIEYRLEGKSYIVFGAAKDTLYSNR
jgi:maltose alpha-D-glucosyltransferase/alpha-amylase